MRYVSGAVIGEDPTATPHALLITPNFLLKVCHWLHTDPDHYFDILSCLSAIDNGPDKKTIEIIYNLYSIPFDEHLMLKVQVDRIKPEVDSVTSVWKTADWHEREAYDLLGVRFRGHPDLRRILMPDDWEGHPLRKDYTGSETYHHVKVEY